MYRKIMASVVGSVCSILASPKFVCRYEHVESPEIHVQMGYSVTVANERKDGNGAYFKNNRTHGGYYAYSGDIEQCEQFMRSTISQCDEANCFDVLVRGKLTQEQAYALVRRAFCEDDHKELISVKSQELAQDLDDSLCSMATIFHEHEKSQILDDGDFSRDAANHAAPLLEDEDSIEWLHDIYRMPRLFKKLYEEVYDISDDSDDYLRPMDYEVSREPMLKRMSRLIHAEPRIIE